MGTNESFDVQNTSLLTISGMLVFTNTDFPGS